ncbi:hypothetical protein [Sphingosinicella sp.]|uniref:hypothetical protein n=1 Tax=Sphingosinicella sp. TaxID=1917971 RepID=UPI0040379C17
MNPKTSEKRRAAFLAALRATGNHSIAAERARVSRRWVCWRKANDPAFARACEAALRQAQGRLRTDPHPSLSRKRERGKSCKPPAGWGAQDGEELVVTLGPDGRRKIVRARLGQWTPRIEARFCTALAACANVAHALRAVGITPASAYRHRARWPDFAARWDAAVAAGREHVERDLVTGAIALLDPEVEPPEGLGPMSVAQAITVARITRRRGVLE